MPSLVVGEILYDKFTHTLRVTYVSGKIYDYKDVPEKVYSAMKAAFSKGAFLNKYVKGKFEFEKVEVK